MFLQLGWGTRSENRSFQLWEFGFWKKACPLPSRQSKPKGRTEISSCSRCHPVRKRQKTLSWNNHTGCISKCHIHASLFFQSRFELDLEITNTKCRCHTLSHVNLRRTCSILFFTPSLSSVVLQSLSVISTQLCFAILRVKKMVRGKRFSRLCCMSTCGQGLYTERKKNSYKYYFALWKELSKQLDTNYTGVRNKK